MANERQDLERLRAAIERENAGWKPGETSVSKLSSEEQQKRLGALPPPGVTLQDLEREGESSRARVMAEERFAGAPAAYDLRNVGGNNFITSIKDQGACGTCVGFGTCAAIEGSIRVALNNPTLAVDLSEAHLFFCLGQADGTTCNSGWMTDRALAACQATGVADNACYPYTAADLDCTGRCSDWASRVTKVTGWHTVTSTAMMKDWISTRGPLTACFLVYDDFFSYRTGVYRHVSGALAGGHCVAIVGYDDAQGCWICKNSWGTGWGESGFFRIAYGQCSIETWQVCAVDGTTFSTWLNNQTVNGVWAIDEPRNAWVHLAGTGWKRIAFDNDVVFYDLLNQLLAAKAARRPVNVLDAQNVIRQAYVQ